MAAWARCNKYSIRARSCCTFPHEIYNASFFKSFKSLIISPSFITSACAWSRKLPVESNQCCRTEIPFPLTDINLQPAYASNMLVDQCKQSCVSILRNRHFPSDFPFLCDSNASRMTRSLLIFFRSCSLPSLGLSACVGSLSNQCCLQNLTRYQQPYDVSFSGPSRPAMQSHQKQQNPESERKVVSWSNDYLII